MKVTAKQRKEERRRAVTRTWMAGRSSRNKTFIDRLCRRLIEKATAVAPEDDFMRDPLIDNDDGFDADELNRFQRGEGG